MTCCRIETDRLLLRPLSEADSGALHAIWTHPLVRRYLWDDRILAEEETASILQKNARLFREHGFGLWGIRLPDTHDLVGFAGYWFFREPPELGFTEVRASTDAPNLAAVGVLERLGMGFERRSTVGGLDKIFYSLPRARWQTTVHDETPSRSFWVSAYGNSASPNLSEGSRS